MDTLPFSTFTSISVWQGVIIGYKEKELKNEILSKKSRIKLFIVELARSMIISFENTKRNINIKE